MLLNTFGFETIDFIALIFFLLAWTVHFWVVNASSFKARTISSQFAIHRHEWMKRMISREARMTDVLIQTSVQHGVLFFASTSILLIGALLAGLASTDQAVNVLINIPFSSTDTHVEWEVKVLLVVFIFTFAFFKFAWAFRLFNYLIIMIGAAPEAPASGADDGDHAAAQVRLDQYAKAMGELHTLSAKHFTTGLNSYFFALCVIAWVLNAWVFIVATIWVSLVLYRRAFRSQFLKTLKSIPVG